MKNKELLEQKITEGAEIQIDIKETFNKKASELSKLAKLKFGTKTSHFNYVRDLLYFKSGVPNEDSKAKLDDLLEKFVIVVQYFKKLGKENVIKNVLEKNDIHIEVGNTFVSVPTGRNDSKFEEMWLRLYPNVECRSMTTHEILNHLMNDALKQKTTIEFLKQEYNQSIIEDVEAKCEVFKNNVKKAVSLKTRKLQQKDISETLEKIEKSSFEFEQIVDVL